MSIHINYLDDDCGVEFLCIDVITGAEIIEANNKLYNNEKFIKQKYQIIDRTKCTGYEVSNEEIRKVAEQDVAAAKVNPSVIVALISSSELQFGMSRVYHSYVGDRGFKTELFWDRNTAEEWIMKKLDK